MVIDLDVSVLYANQLKKELTYSMLPNNFVDTYGVTHLNSVLKSLKEFYKIKPTKLNITKK